MKRDTKTKSKSHKVTTYSKMSVYRSVSGRPGKVFVFSVRYVLMCTGVSVFLREPEIDYVYEVALLSETHQEIIRFYVAMNEVLAVDVFDTADL